MAQIGYKYEEPTWIYEESGRIYNPFYMENTISTLASIKNYVERTIQARGDIKVLGVTKTISALGAIQRTIEVTIQSKSRIKQIGITKSITSKSRVMVNVSKTIQAKSAILVEMTKTISSQSRIKILNITKTIRALSRIKVTFTNTILGMANIIEKSNFIPIIKIREYNPVYARVDNFKPISIINNNPMPIGR